MRMVMVTMRMMTMMMMTTMITMITMITMMTLQRKKVFGGGDASGERGGQGGESSHG